jgi:peptidoglycan hydrolase CwlO-like protein
MWENNNQLKTSEIQTKTPETKSGILKSSAVAFVLATTQVQANDLLDQCDFNGNWKIDTKQDYKAWLVSKDIAKKEFKCGLKYDIAKLDGDIAKLDGDIAKWREDIAKLDGDIAKLDGDIAKLDGDIAKWREDIAKLDMNWKKIAEIIHLLKNK